MLMVLLGKYGEGMSDRDSSVWMSVATVNDLRLTKLEIKLPIIPDIISFIIENNNYREQPICFCTLIDSDIIFILMMMPQAGASCILYFRNQQEKLLGIFDTRRSADPQNSSKATYINGRSLGCV